MRTKLLTSLVNQLRLEATTAPQCYQALCLSHAFYGTSAVVPCTPVVCSPLLFPFNTALQSQQPTTMHAAHQRVQEQQCHLKLPPLVSVPTLDTQLPHHQQQLPVFHPAAPIAYPSTAIPLLDAPVPLPDPPVSSPDAPAPILCIKRTFQPSNLVRKRRHGFLARLRSRGGRKVLKRRRLKGRWSLTA